MAHKKETPRQKMIGMMYLVLTALLALNVSKDILDAFALVDKGLTTTTENFSDKNKHLYDNFTKLALSNPTKVRPWQKKAEQVSTRANELYNYIQTLKIRIIMRADSKSPAVDTTSNKDKKSIEPEKINSKENTDIPSHIMIGENNNAEGKVLKKKIEDYKNFILSLATDQNVKNSINTNLNTSDPKPNAKDAGEKKTWESEHFEHLPLIAVTTIMSKIQNDVRNAESEIVQYLSDQIDAGSFKFNQLEPTIVANSNYILRGSEYKAEVFIAASDTTQRPRVYIGAVEEIKGADDKIDYRMVGKYDSLPTTSKGRAVYQRAGGGVGNIKWGGLIQLRATDGSTIKRRFNAEYQVGEAIAVVSPTKMNVFYIGVDNPVDISVAGVPANKVFPTINNGAISKNGNSWVVRPRSTGKATVTVTAEIDGKRKTMANMPFRVKDIPNPVAKVGGKKFGPIGKNELLAQSVVFAEIEGFDFDAPFRVTDFVVSATIHGFRQDELAHNNKITEAQRTLIRNLSKGDKVYFDDIKAVGPDGRSRELPTLTLKIQ
jgi:gliding motility-associated protein GldM